MANFTFSNLKTLEKNIGNLSGRTIEGKLTVKKEILVSNIQEREDDTKKATLRHKSELGRGGMGVIFSVEQRTLERDVVVKELRPELAEQERHRTKFLEEAVITGNLEHPNIPPTYNLDIERCRWSMKKVRGQDLEKVLEEPYDKKEILRKLLPVMDALSFAHSKGVIHRDLKPENIMIGEFGEVYLMDWGIAQINNVSNQPLALKKIREKRKIENGAIAGTPLYMAPEQANGLISKIDEKTDIYTMGCIIYRITTGRLPIEAEAIYSLLAKKINPETKIVPPKDRELAAICRKAMAFRQEDRYQSVEELKQDLLNYLSNRKVSVCDYGSIERMIKWVQNNAAKTMGILAGAAVLTGGIIAGSTAIIAYNNTLTARIEAEAEKTRADKAELSKQLADKEKERANAAKTLALQEKEILGLEKINAEKEKEKAEQDKILAQKEKERAELAKALAEKEKESAEIARRLAEKERDAAKLEVSGQQKSEAILESLDFLRKDDNYYEAALQVFKRAIESSPEYWRPYFLMAEHQAYFGHNEEAEINFKKANEVYKNLFGAYSAELLFATGMNYGLPMELGGKGEEEKALEYFEKAFSISPNDIYGKLSRTISLVIKASLDQNNAETYLPEAIRISKELTEDALARNIDAVWEVRALALGADVFEKYSHHTFKKHSDFSEAKKSLERIVDENKGPIPLRQFLGYIYTETGEPEKAISLFSKLIRIKKEPIYYLGRGAAYLAKKEYDPAIRDFTEAIKSAPEIASIAYNDRAFAWGEKGNFEQAIIDYDESIKIRPTAGKYNSRGITHYQNGDIERADYDYRKALELNPRYWQAWRNMGQMYKFLKRFPESLQCYRNAYQFAPENEKERAELLQIIKVLEKK